MVRQLKDNRAADISVRLDVNFSAVPFDNPTTNGQADPCAWVLTAGVQSLKDYENPLRMLWGNSDSIIFDADRPVAIVALF